MIRHIRLSSDIFWQIFFPYFRLNLSIDQHTLIIRMIQNTIQWSISSNQAFNHR